MIKWFKWADKSPATPPAPPAPTLAEIDARIYVAVRREFLKQKEPPPKPGTIRYRVVMLKGVDEPNHLAIDTTPDYMRDRPLVESPIVVRIVEDWKETAAK